MSKNRLSMYVICCHVDKAMDEGDLKSKYNIPIQAGVALTDKRICDINDYDDFPESISDRNKRYSEMTAMYWIGKHIDSEYIGISHYRRRFLLSDELLEDYINKGFDIITTEDYPLPQSIKACYIDEHYAKDWDLFMEILKEQSPEDVSLAEEVYSREYIHPCNMNIFKADIYKEYCEYVFPILDTFYSRSPLKKDIYQRRDVGFIGERLSSLFVEKIIREGKKVFKAPFKDLRTKGWSPEDECDLSNHNLVYEKCRRFYDMDDISKCRLMVAATLDKGGIYNPKLRTLLYLFRAAMKEQNEYDKTLFEYLPDEYKKDLDTLVSMFEGVINLVKILSQGITSEGVKIFRDFMGTTGFTKEVFEMACEMTGKDKDIYNQVS